jgi:hypothetical protein
MIRTLLAGLAGLLALLVLAPPVEAVDRPAPAYDAVYLRLSGMG